MASCTVSKRSTRQKSYKRSHSGIRVNNPQKVNLQTMKIGGKTYKNVSTRAAKGLIKKLQNKA